MTTPLLDRIKEAEQRQRRADVRYLRPSEPVEFKPRWLTRLTDKDQTASIYSDGCGPSGRAA